MLFALAGSIAQLIDGSLGMGFGLTSSTLLLTLGASAAVASAAVHAAEIGTPWHQVLLTGTEIILIAKF